MKSFGRQRSQDNLAAFVQKAFANHGYTSYLHKMPNLSTNFEII
ncbi:hypothetical protein WH8501_15180 [Crocosphaera watsonii WH 8501]|nr:MULTISPECIES: hypothetical protein [Crocosphaera]